MIPPRLSPHKNGTLFIALLGLLLLFSQCRMRYEAMAFPIEHPNEIGLPEQKAIALYHQESQQLFLIDSIKQVGDTLYFSQRRIPDYLPHSSTRSFHTRFKYKDENGKNVPTTKLPKPKDIVIFSVGGTENWPSRGKMPLAAVIGQSSYRPKYAKTVFLNTVAIGGSFFTGIAVIALYNFSSESDFQPF